MFQLFVRHINDDDGESQNKYEPQFSKLASNLQSRIETPVLYKKVAGVPRIIGFAYTDKIAELKMDFCGDCVQTFMNSYFYTRMSVYKKTCIVFDMIRQIIWPLSQLHRAGFVHGDIKPENICMKPWPLTTGSIGGFSSSANFYQSEYEFTLIDFGIMSKFKVKKASKIYSQHIGNLMFSSLRGLRCMQTRFQDDFESLMYMAYYFIEGVLPWDVDYSKN